MLVRVFFLIGFTGTTTTQSAIQTPGTVQEGQTRLKSTLPKENDMTILTDVSDDEDDVQMLDPSKLITPSSEQVPHHTGTLTRTVHKEKSKNNLQLSHTSKPAVAGGSHF